jgi:hypothetical protein
MAKLVQEDPCLVQKAICLVLDNKTAWQVGSNLALLCMVVCRNM